ncbi:hypothetical protein [Halorhodospira halophila]|uniref:Uncharacterized protein n=1 Tax=Halorhodospira halophila (strain DSM 244 / SL1) TaxID=349124 RepID=A1WUV3_HALHL|nr:hypothetical protein [Halorhodospira halophila]ABM61465.1 hypothetical protein Hhal_0683 [Halorhodospira halophila SL1]MBK1728712.1 hypothetical protein [Halorhodospira halophila]
MNSPDDQPQPPLLYDVVIPGEQVRADGGPWLRPEGDGGDAPDPPQPPFTKEASTPAGPAAQPGETGSGRPAADADAAQRAEIEREATRALARHLRSELERRLPEALREAEAPIRKAVDDALIDAVAASRRQQTPETTDTPGTPDNAPGADTHTNQPAPNR